MGELSRLKGTQSKIPSAVVFCQNPLMGVLDNFFPLVPIQEEVQRVSSLKHVMKSTTKKNTVSVLDI